MTYKDNSRYKAITAETKRHKSITTTSRAARRKKLLGRCAELAKRPDVLAEFEQEIERLGLVGERRNAKTLLLAIVSRSSQRPVSIVVKGVRSGGKNTLVSKVLSFFPSSAYYELTAMSDKALARFSPQLKHRMLVITEAAGLKDGGDYFVRSLLSEGRLKYEVAHGKGTRTVEIEGPTGLIMTTTHTKLYDDDETRLFSLEVADSPEHTGHVLRAIGKAFADPIKMHHTKVSEQWPALLEFISLDPVAVKIPFAESATALTANDDPRLSRDAWSMLELVAAHARLHQFTRKKSSDGTIIATLADYKAVRALVGHIIARGINAAVTSMVRKTVQAVATLASKGGDANMKQLMAALGLSKSVVSRHTKAAIEGGYLKNLSEGNRPARYVLAEEPPDSQSVVPSTKAVRKHWEAARARVKALNTKTK